MRWELKKEQSVVAVASRLRQAGRQPHSYPLGDRRQLATCLEPVAKELSPSLKRPLTVLGEGRGAQGGQGHTTFHLQTVEHRTAVHHVQHGTAGPQAGEDLEDKSHLRLGSGGQPRGPTGMATVSGPGL